MIQTSNVGPFFFSLDLLIRGAPFLKLLLSLTSSGYVFPNLP